MIPKMPKNFSTFLKYLFSYVLIFTVLMAVFFLILRSQLADSYQARQTERVQTQMASAGNHLLSEIKFLNQTDILIIGNADIKLATYRADPKYWRITHLALEQYAKSSSLIDNIMYYTRFSDRIISTREYVTLSDGVFAITNEAQQTVLFDPAPYLDNPVSQLIWLEGEAARYLLWFPSNPANSSYLYFYTLDTQVIHSQLKTLLSNDVVAVALLDGQGRCVTGSGFQDYAAALEGKQPTQGIYPMEDGTSLYLSAPIQDGFVLAAVVSGEALKQQVSGAFFHSYLNLLSLSLVGIALVYVAMLFTYRPLQRLVKSLGHEAGRHQNYLELISENYSALSDQKAQLEATLAQYRQSLAQYRQRRAYPHEALGRLSDCLEDKRFSDARDLVDTLLVTPEGEPDYFHSCIVLDCLTVITNSMSLARIEFSAYRNAFLEAVTQCRDIQDRQSFSELTALIHELLFFYEKETVDQLLHTTPLRQMVADNFCDPNFSISVIAEAYHVSDSRMSTLFKEEMGIGFTDCVWQMRLEKAQQLLRETQMSLEEISFAVGYLAHSSFGRKFKQATGMTPSQYRNQFSTGEETERAAL